jgi:hypothetical protein
MELEVSSNLQWKAVRYLVRYQVHFPFWTAKHGFGQTVGVVRNATQMSRNPGIQFAQQDSVSFQTGTHGRV